MTTGPKPETTMSKEKLEDVGSWTMSIGFGLPAGEEQAQTLGDPTGEEEYFGQMMHTAIEVAPVIVAYFPAGHKAHVF